jgi:hypothetical protein
MRVQSSGAVKVRGVTYQIARELAGHTILAAELEEGVKFLDDAGELLLEHPWPAPGTKHVSNGRPRGSGAARPKDTRNVIGAGAPPSECRRTVRADGRVSIRNVVYGLGKAHAGRAAHVVCAETVSFRDASTGEIIAEHPIPKPGVKHVGFTRHNRKAPASTTTGAGQLSPMSRDITLDQRTCCTSKWWDSLAGRAETIARTPGDRRPAPHR